MATVPRLFCLTIMVAHGTEGNKEAGTMEYVYHYTSLENAIEIIRGIKRFRWQNDDGEKYEDPFFIFHASRYNCMNDPNEFCFAKRKVHKVLGIQESKDYDYRLIPYIVSFCKSCDNPVMWRLYNAKIAFKFDKDMKHYLSAKTSWAGRDVFYVPDNCDVSNNQALLEYIKIVKNIPIEKSTDVSFTRENMYQLLVYPFIKHSDFAFENEWRIAEYDVRNNPKSEEQLPYTPFHEFATEVDCKGVRNGKPYLYKEAPIPYNALKGIIINEHNQTRFEEIKEGLSVLLNSRGCRVSNDFITSTTTAEVR